MRQKVHSLLIRAGIAGVLALVLLRALVPVGFMLAVVDGAPMLVLCEGQGVVPDAAAHHHHHAGHDAPDSARYHAQDCAYAQSAAPALLPPLDLPGIAGAVESRRTPAPESRPFCSPLPRYRAARGPPLFA